MADNQKLRKNITEKEFELYVLPFLPLKPCGANIKVPLWKIYNYIARVLCTGMQWAELQNMIDRDATGKREIHYTTVFRRFSLWTSFNVFERSHQVILAAANDAGQLDLTVLNGDGTNSIAKKGAPKEAIADINTKLAQNG